MSLGSGTLQGRLGLQHGSRDDEDFQVSRSLKKGDVQIEAEAVERTVPVELSEALGGAGVGSLVQLRKGSISLLSLSSRGKWGGHLD